MSQHLLLLTGSLAEAALRQVLEGLGETAFSWEVRNLGVKVAALMTSDMILRRLDNVGDADRVILPGRCRGDLSVLTQNFGVPFERGPEELRDLPEWLGLGGRPVDLAQYDVRIFAEITDAPQLDPASILDLASGYRQDGADVIDIGCNPGQPFPHLAETVRTLKSEGFAVSVDSLDPDDLLTGGRAGADYLLSLTADTLWIADEVAATPILIPSRPGELADLVSAWETLRSRGRDALVDAILDPIHFGFVDSIVRYHELRRRLPEAEIMIGTGNLTELTEADTTGMHALLLGMVSELRATAVLTTQVSPHCRSVIREADLARRVMYRARAEATLPKRLHGGLTGLHERQPFPYDSAEIRASAAQVKDRNYRIQVGAEGIHLYNRDGLYLADDPYQLFPSLALQGDTGHAFYLGVELARAEIAHQLGKRYTQDQPLDWGAATPDIQQDLHCYAAPATTKSKRPG